MNDYAHGGPTEDAVRIPEFPDQFARTHRFSLGVPRRFTVSPDGRRVLFLRSPGGDDPVSGVWLYESGRERLIADPRAMAAGPAEVPEEERVRRERARETSSGVVAYATDAEARLVAFTLGGELWTVRTDDGRGPRRVPTAGPAVDPRPSPDGESIAYVTGGALHVLRLGGGDLTLAAPEGPGVSYGLAEHAAAESMGRSRGYWWSPGSDALLVARVDDTPVRRWYIADPADPAKPPRAIPYPAAGTANAEVSLRIVRLDGTTAGVRLPAAADESSHPPGTWTDTAFEYVASAGWDGSGPYARVQTRDQRTAVLLAVDPLTGGTEPLDSEHDAAWVELVPGLPGRTASGAAITARTAGDGLRGLRIGTADSPAGVHVREVLAVHGERVWFSANEDPSEVHVWYHDPAAGFIRLSEGPGVHRADAGGDTVVLDSQTETGRTVTVLEGGAPAGRIAVLAEEPVVAPRPVLLSLGERELRGQLYFPSWHRPGSGRLPVLLNPYSGPQMQLAVRARAWWTCVSQWFAEQGFAVLTVDGRGTSGRGREWEKAVHGDRLAPVLRDQIDALHAAAERYPDLDLGAVAIRGWSYGGYLAAGAVLHHPEVFHAAAAGAAPTDRRLYDTHWEERFLGDPEVFPEAYERSSLVPYAHQLSRPLLLTHGVADDNVFFAHTLRLSAALLAAGRPHSVLPLSGASHTVTGRGQASSLLRLEAAFLKRSLRTV
ncbi:S9 family peptidase [Streptomyces katsurahamanus]|uniref:S9 family peptidase n=1 Tax=Streptomyces katsurahamanus TaxID=2577098 RepID=A0ABW9NVU7_9ACTN|nr:prolyl oligopeptidase family serine peptidase [Streptomyces katsurahamanus]MQS37271.1 S9 family peptidase [Streptomyces katsurahamanus]